MGEPTQWTMADTYDLLAVIQTFDDRNFQEAHALSWNAVANDGRWPHMMAVHAVRLHYLNSTDPIMPANVHAYVREHKQDQAMRNYDRPTEGRPVTGNVMAFIERNWRTDDEVGIISLAVPCPFEGCRVPPSQPCMLGGYLAGRRKRHQPHPGRHYALAEEARAAGYDPSFNGPECPACGAPEGLRCMNLGRGSYLSAHTAPHALRRGEAA